MNKEQRQIINDFYNKLYNGTVDPSPESSKIIDDHFFDLVGGRRNKVCAVSTMKSKIKAFIFWLKRPPLKYFKIFAASYLIGYILGSAIKFIIK